MRYFCLCMSPAIDALVRLPSAPKGEGEIFKDVADEENVGGKTINVARWLAIRSRSCSLVPPSAHSLPRPRRFTFPPSAHSLPSPSCSSVVCGGLLGEDNAALFARELAKYGIEDRFLRVPGSTRRNEMVTWPGGAFKVNRAAFPDVPTVRAEDVLAGADGADVAILSGSLPKCCAPSFYADCVKILKAKGIAVVLDASGKALELGVAAGPDLIKPNAEECEPLVGFVPKTPDDFRRATEILKEKISAGMAASEPKPAVLEKEDGAGLAASEPKAEVLGKENDAGLAASEPKPAVLEKKNGAGLAASEPKAERANKTATIIISDGGAGAWFDGEFVPAPKVDVVDTTAAGDTLLAEWCFSHDPKLAVAAGSAACTMPGSRPPVEAFANMV